MHGRIVAGTNFLMELFEEGVGYSVINTARSALSTVVHLIDGYTFGEHPIVSRFLAGVFKKRPSLPRYIVTYDPQKILNFLKSLPSWDNIGIKWLTFRTVAILILASGHRGQTINVLSLDYMDIESERVIFYIPECIKNTSPSFHAKPLCLPCFQENDYLCPVRNVIEYIKATACKRKTRRLIVSFSTFAAISCETLRRYLKEVLMAAGIDTKIFTPHSTRHASNSKKKMTGIPVEKILEAGGWRGGSTFQKHYNLPIRKDI
jgi:hypothetical protein